MQFKKLTDDDGEDYYRVHQHDHGLGLIYRDGNGTWYWYHTSGKLYAGQCDPVMKKLDELNGVSE